MNFLHYLVQVNLYLVLFYGFYRLLLFDETFYGLNRAYLVGSAILSFGIPFWYSDYIQSFFITQQVSEVFYTVLSPAVFEVRATTEHPFTWYDLLKIFYISCTIFLAIKLIFNLIQLKKLLQNSPAHLEQGVSFSFFNFVFVDKDLQKREVVLEHEYVHIKQLHSADVMLFELIAVLCWFNPVVYFYKKSIKNIHEFIADDIASRLEPTKADYAMLLFSQQFGLNPHQLTNPFFKHSTLKRRIEMLQKPRSRKIALLKYGFTAPLFALMLVIASASIARHQTIERVANIVEITAKMPISELPVAAIDDFLEVVETPIKGRVIAAEDGKPLAGVAITIRGKNIGTTTDVDGNYQINANPVDELIFTFVGFETSSVLVSDKKIINVSLRTGSQISIEGRGQALSEIVVAGHKLTNTVESEEIFTTVEENPTFPDGIKNMYQYIARNLRYPESAQKANVQGKVFVKFIVRKDGSVSDLQVLKGIGFGCDEETVRVLGSMPKWNPGKQNGKPVNVYFTMPVNFILEEVKRNTEKGDFQWDKLIVIENGKTKTFSDREEIRKENERLKKTIGDIDKHEISFNTIEKSMTIRVLDKPKSLILNQPNLSLIDGDPLFVIDGKASYKDEMSKLNPNEIATVDVLRNASATAIYGEKGKNGVVIITTKTHTQVKEDPNFTIKGKQLYTLKVGNKRQIIDAITANDYPSDRIMQVNVIKLNDIKARKTALNEYEEKVLKEGYDGWVDIWVKEQ
ncbi:TonB family protein [Emticicia sp. SJ17W-69]|uniref:TonB family protein n=1 Tax=Emticicia sp. SJ17W-69 TaxID=3421657 RepID=UPI003EBAF182